MRLSGQGVRPAQIESVVCHTEYRYVGQYDTRVVTLDPAATLLWCSIHSGTCIRPDSLRKTLVPLQTSAVLTSFNFLNASTCPGNFTSSQARGFSTTFVLHIVCVFYYVSHYFSTCFPTVDLLTALGSPKIDRERDASFTTCHFSPPFSSATHPPFPLSSL